MLARLTQTVMGMNTLVSVHGTVAGCSAYAQVPTGEAMTSADDSPQAQAEARIRIGGRAGFGIKAAGQTLARTFARAGLETFDLTEYPSLIRGGHNTYLLRVAPYQLHSHVEPVDLLVALNQETLELHAAELVDGGAVLFDPDDFDAATLIDTDRFCLVPVPLASIVESAGGPAIMRNTAALGAILGHLDFPMELSLIHI